MPRRQPDLFQDAPSVPTARDLRIIPRGRTPLGKEQQTFNRLLSQVQKLRDELSEWSEFESRHQQRVAADLMPLLDELAKARRELILLCAGILAGREGGGAATRTERRQLVAFVLELSESHLMDNGDDEEVIAVYDRHASRSFAKHQAEQRRRSRAMAKEMFGIDIGDDRDVDPIEAMLEAALDAAEAAERADREQANASQRRRRSARARQREAERAAAAEQAAREMSQSVREVYRKLASALHPDRGADDGERHRRHQLMQRVNAAYDSRDLLGLLTLQLQIEQIDEDHLATVSPSRLRHYNQILRDQVKELKHEMAAITDRLSMAMERPPRRLTPRAVERDLERCVAEVRSDLTGLREHANDLLDPRYRRRWLQEYTRESRQETLILQQIEELLMSGNGIDIPHHTFDSNGSAPRQRRRKSKRRRKQH